jgi:hypothetical protein
MYIFYCSIWPSHIQSQIGCYYQCQSETSKTGARKRNLFVLLSLMGKGNEPININLHEFAISFSSIVASPITMRSRFSRPFNADQQGLTMPSGENGNSLPTAQSGSSMATSNDSDGAYESAHDLDMVWENGRELGNSGTVKSESNGGGWANTSNTALINSWTSPSPFVSNPAAIRVPTWDSAVGNEAFTITTMPLMGIPRDPFRQITTPKQSTDIGQRAKSEHEASHDAVNPTGTLLPRAATSSPFAKLGGTQLLAELSSRAGQMDLGNAELLNKGIWGSLPVAVENSSQLERSLSALDTATPMIGFPYTLSNDSTDNATKRPPQPVSVPAGRKLSSSIHAAAAAAMEKKPYKDQGIERGKRNMESKAKKEVLGGKKWGRASGHEKQQRAESGNRNNNSWGKPIVSASPSSLVEKG